MQTKNNAFDLKAKIRPRDYRRAQTCKFRNMKTGEMIEVPVELVQALREGKLERMS